MYTSYCVVVRASSSSDEKKTAVRRRYSDFQWLFRRLHGERPGAIVPIMAHVVAVLVGKRLSEDVVSKRRTAGEDWLNRIIVHPELKDSPSLLSFLKQDDDMFLSAKRSNDSSLSDSSDQHGDDDGPMMWSSSVGSSGDGPAHGTPGNAGRERFSRIKKFATKVKVAIRSNSDLEKSENEAAFESIDEYASSLESQVTQLSKHCTALIKTYEDQSKTLEVVGSKFTEMGAMSFPNTHSSNSSRLSSLLNKVGDGVSALSITEERRHEQLRDRLKNPVKDLVRDVRSLRDAVQRRKEVQITYTDMISRTVKRTNNLDRIRTIHANGGVGAKGDSEEKQMMKEVEAERVLEGAKRDAVRWHDEFDAASRRLLRESERFGTMFRTKVRKTVADWAEVQVEFYSASNEGWGYMLPVLDAKGLVGEDIGGGGYTFNNNNGGGSNGGGGSTVPQVAQI